MSTAARSHNVQLQSDATRESRDGCGEMVEWRQAKKGERVCLSVQRSIRGFGEGKGSSKCVKYV